MDGNVNTGIRRFASDLLSARRRLIVGASGTAQDADLGLLFKANDGVAEHYTAITGATGAISNVRSGYDDQIDLASNFTTAVAAADLATLENDGVHVRSLVPRVGHTNDYISYRPTNTLPQGAAGHLFTVTGRVKVLAIHGVVTTVIGSVTNNTKLTANATVNGATDICSTTDLNAAAVGTILSITGTLATALVKTTGGAFVYQASPVVCEAGFLDLNCSGSTTGSIKWACIWTPVDPGARVLAA